MAFVKRIHLNCFDKIKDDPKHLSLNENKFGKPTNIIQFGNKVIIVDSYKHQIRIVSLVQNYFIIDKIIGNGKGFKNGHFETVQFNCPISAVVLNEKTLLVTDSGNCCIRIVLLDLEIVNTLNNSFRLYAKYNDYGNLIEIISFYKIIPKKLLKLLNGELLLIDKNSHEITQISKDLEKTKSITCEYDENNDSSANESFGKSKFIMPKDFVQRKDGSILIIDGFLRLQEIRNNKAKILLTLDSISKASLVLLNDGRVMMIENYSNMMYFIYSNNFIDTCQCKSISFLKISSLNCINNRVLMTYDKRIMELKDIPSKNLLALHRNKILILSLLHWKRENSNYERQRKKRCLSKKMTYTDILKQLLFGYSVIINDIISYL